MLRDLASTICHQAASRSWVVGDATLIVCQRCTGIYLGLLLGFVVLRVAGRHAGALDRIVHLCLMAQLPVHVWQPAGGAPGRTLSGLLFGVGAAWLLADGAVSGRRRHYVAGSLLLVALAGLAIAAAPASLARHGLDLAIVAGFMVIPWSLLSAVVGRRRRSHTVP